MTKIVVINGYTKIEDEILDGLNLRGDDFNHE